MFLITSYLTQQLYLFRSLSLACFLSRRRSCSGWNIWNVVLDFMGGVLSLLQLVGDAVDLDDFSSITGNTPKLGLSLISMIFDVSNIICR